MNRLTRSAILTPAAALCLALCAAAVANAQEPTPAPAAPPARQPDAPKKANARAAEAERAAEPFDAATPKEMAARCVKLETEAGVIEIEMLAETAPETARNFLNLVATGFYDTTTFSRVVPGFVVQGGNLRTREQLTPGLAERARRTVPDEPNEVRHVRGVVSMARSDEPNSATTNFFFLVGEAGHLDGKFAAFARVRSGMDVVDAINKAPVEGEKPVKPVRLNRATVAECAPAPKPEDEK
ncbi:MAG TPA: peptidylprolyl isomerase [Pyrinomonadaceae bacterium]|nr:peptidylprolyl isomerase [Pyrinomonadaceae bacterium]